MFHFLSFIIGTSLFSTTIHASALTDLIAGKSPSKSVVAIEYTQQLETALALDSTITNKNRALEVAVRSVDEVAVEFLLKQGADATYVSKLGKKRPLLHISLKWISNNGDDPSSNPKGHTRIIELLMNAGADPSVKDEEGNTASDLTFYTKNGWRLNQAPLSAIIRILKTHPVIDGISLAEITKEDRRSGPFLRPTIVADCLLELILSEANYDAYLWFKGLNPNLITILDAPLVEQILSTKSVKEISAYLNANKTFVGNSSFNLVHTLGLKSLYQPFIEKNPRLMLYPLGKHPLLRLIEAKDPDFASIDSLINLARQYKIDLHFKGVLSGQRKETYINYFVMAITNLMVRNSTAFANGIEHYVDGGWAKVRGFIPTHKEREEVLKQALVRWFHENKDTASAAEVQHAIDRYRSIIGALKAEIVDFRHLVVIIRKDVEVLLNRLQNNFPREHFMQTFGRGVELFEQTNRSSYFGTSCENATGGA